MKTAILIISTFFLFSFSFAQNISFERTTDFPEFQDADTGDMEFADIDNDGDADMVLTGKGNSQVATTTLYRNDGNGNFSEIVENGIENVHNSHLDFNDVDNDGDLDLLISGVTHGGSNSFNLYFNDGAGNFTLAANTPFDVFQSSSFDFGDIDNDGDDDLLIIGSSASYVEMTKLYENDGTGTFTEINAPSFEELAIGAVEFFDYDNDADLDVIINGVDANDNRFTGLYANNGSGAFSLVTNTIIKNYSGGDIAIGDSDQDGDLDVLICGQITNSDIETELYLNDGAGNFTLLENTVFSDVAFGEISFNDLDNDGDLDVFVLGSGEGGLGTNSIVGNVYENLGANNYVVSDSLVGAYLASHAVADIDGDNDLDLILGGTTIGNPTRATWMYENVTPITVSIKDVSTKNDLELYPNPANNFTTIDFSLEENSNVQVAIYNNLGQVVQQINLGQLSKGSYQEQLDVSSLANGFYNVSLQVNETIAIKRIVKLKNN